MLAKGHVYFQNQEKTTERFKAGNLKREFYDGGHPFSEQRLYKNEQQNHAFRRNRFLRRGTNRATKTLIVS